MQHVVDVSPSRKGWHKKLTYLLFYAHTGEAYRDAVVLNTAKDHSSVQAAVVKLDEHAMLSIPNCSTTSLRLTESSPFQAGGVWYSSFQSIEDGFDTIFSFRVSCSRVNSVRSFLQ